MKWIRNIIGAALLMAGMNACFETPTYPKTPQIEFIDNELYFGRSADNDSIVIVLKFKDGDGDLGLSDDDSDVFKYAPKYNYRTGNGTQIVNYDFKRKNPSFEINLLDATSKPLSDFNFVTPYNCTNWEIVRNANNVVTDTVFVLFNPDYYNIFIDFYTKNSDGKTFTKFDPTTYFKYPNCAISFYNGRFPILSKDLGRTSPLDGKITYSLKGQGFVDIFNIKTLQLKVRIQDRALNKSNEVTSKEFTLTSIRR